MPEKTESHALVETDRIKREWRGAACVGMLTARWPFGKLAVGPSDVDLSSLLGHFVLPKEKVVCVERAGFFPWLWCGIRIRHSVSEHPQRLMFCPIFSRSRGIMQHFKSLGYNVP